jgi:hypothetical protein
MNEQLKLLRFGRLSVLLSIGIVLVAPTSTKMASIIATGPPPELSATPEARDQQKLTMPIEPKVAVSSVTGIPSMGTTKPLEEAKIREIEIRKQDLGIQIYSKPVDGQETTVDIVAVHGLSVNPRTTWTHPQTKQNWLQDESMLPAAVPSARIMGFCYESRWIGESAVWQSLDSIANELLEALRHERLKCSDRPIVFIGHCLGGLVIQQVR